jgi:ubiquinone/menaquinone biosynthesis C-methylase UbiE
MTLYNTIGAEYNQTRKADPYLAERIYNHLAPVPDGLYLDIGCGTGNYLHALAKKGLKFYGIDPSETMLRQVEATNERSVFIQAAAENIPLPDNFFDGAIAVLTTHHWQNLLSGLKEINRVLKPGARLVVFSFTPEQMRGYWLYHYFPKMIEKCTLQLPGLKEMQQLFDQSGFSVVELDKYFVKKDLQDHFLYSNKYVPEMYLSEKVRNNASGFRVNADKEELSRRLALLESDIATGEINTIIRKYENDLGDYLFYVLSNIK